MVQYRSQWYSPAKRLRMLDTLFLNQNRSNFDEAKSFFILR